LPTKLAGGSRDGQGFFFQLKLDFQHDAFGRAPGLKQGSSGFTNPLSSSARPNSPRAVRSEGVLSLVVAHKPHWNSWSRSKRIRSEI